MRRAMDGCLSSQSAVRCGAAPAPSATGPRPDVRGWRSASCPGARRGGRVLQGWCEEVRGPPERLALALLVTRVVADHHDPAVAADHLALVADLLDARLDLHRVFPDVTTR